MSRSRLFVHADLALMAAGAILVLVKVIGRLDNVTLHATPCVYCIFKQVRRHLLILCVKSGLLLDLFVLDLL